MSILLDDDKPDSYRASMDIRERKIDPRFHTVPLSLLILEMGNNWLDQQQELFNEIIGQ